MSFRGISTRLSLAMALKTITFVALYLVSYDLWIYHWIA